MNGRIKKRFGHICSPLVRPFLTVDYYQAAVERAKQLRQERQQSSENHSFKPQINSRPSYLDNRAPSAGGGDSLDHLTGKGGDSNDVFEQPLPGARGGNNAGGAPQPQVSEVRRQPMGRGRVDTKQDLEYKNQFLSQYEKKHAAKNQMEATPYAPTSAPEPVQIETDDSFMQSLRGGDDGGGWNNDTSFAGFDACPSRVSKKPTSGSKGPQSSGKADVAQARSRLSLLKSKIQKQTASPVVTETPTSALLRSNSAHNIEDDIADLPSSKPQRSNARGPRRRDVEHSEWDNNTDSQPRSAPMQQQPAQSRIPPRRSHDNGAAPRKPDLAPVNDDYGVAPQYGSQKSSFNAAEEIDSSADEYGGQQMECPDCHRKFNPIPYEKHVKICAKVFLQKRKVFDSAKMRVEDNPELLKLAKQKKKEEAVAARRQKKAVGNNRPVGGGGEGGGGSKKWKQQSNAFREAMRAARNVTVAQASGAPLPPAAPSAPDPSLIPCPHCGRRFNEKAAERHIPQCQNIRAKPTSLKRGTGGAGGKTGSAAPPISDNKARSAPKRPTQR